MFYQVTAMYQDSEIGYGEGESLQCAKQEALEQVPSFYPREEVKLSVLKSNVY